MNDLENDHENDPFKLSDIFLYSGLGWDHRTNYLRSKLSRVRGESFVNRILCIF